MKSNVQNVNAGDLAISVAKLGTATNAQFVKALWSIRGTVLLRNPLPLFGYPVELTRSKLIDSLRTQPGDDACPLLLVPGKHSAEWFIGEGTPVAPKAKAKAGTKAKRVPKAKPVGTEPDAGGTEPQGTEPADASQE